MTPSECIIYKMEQEGPVYNVVFRKIILYGKKNIFMTEKKIKIKKKRIILNK